MCKVEDLCVMVVDPDEEELQKSCDSLRRLGLVNIVCVYSYEQAMATMANIHDIDIVLADYDIEEGQDLGMLLVSVIKKEYPSILVVLTSKDYSCSIVLDSLLYNHTTADDILDKNREGDIEELMGKWITLARVKNETRDLIHGTKKRPS